MDWSHSIEPHELLRHADFLRRLSRALVTDEQSAEDLVQHAWLAALERPPKQAGDLRGWLSNVVRRRAANVRRDDARRKEREERSAGPAAREAEERAVENTLELQRAVAAAVHSLREPYRGVIYQRYFRSLSPREIARHEGAPLATIETRLRRGRELLRKELDRESGGDRAAWCAALIPLIREPSGHAATLLGAILMGTQLKIIVAVAAVAGLALVWMVEAGESAVPEPGYVEAIADAPRAELVSPALTQELISLEGPTERRELARSATRPDEDVAQPPAEPEQRTVLGQALNVSGEPVPGLEVAFVSSLDEVPAAEAPRTVAGADGRFALNVEQRRGFVIAFDDEWVTFFAGFVRPSSDGADSIIVVARPMSLRGSVVDDSGMSLAGARVGLQTPADFGRSLGPVMENSQKLGFVGLADADGRFSIERVPRVPGAQIRALMEGHVPFAVGQPDVELWDEVITLQVLESDRDSLEGRVIDAAGAGIEGARVSYGLTSTATDDKGFFRFGVDVLQEEEGVSSLGFRVHRLIAAAPGYLPAVQEAPINADGAAPGWPALVVLRLTEPALSICGRVSDAQGEPLAGLLVYVPQTQLLARGGFPQITVLESVLAGEPSPFGTITRSDASGRFELRGLLDRDYRVTVTDEVSLVNTTRPSVAAGTDDLEIVFDTGDVWREVRGVVLTEGGAPVAGVVVQPRLMTQEAHYDGRGVSRTSIESSPTRTDAEGEFRLSNVPRQGVYLKVHSDDIVPIWHYSLPPEGHSSADRSAHLDGLEIVVQRKVRAQLTLTAPTPADRFAIVDDGGTALILNVDLGGTNNADFSAGVIRGRSELFSVSESAQTLILYEGQDELERIPLYLESGVLNLIEGP